MTSTNGLERSDPSTELALWSGDPQTGQRKGLRRLVRALATSARVAGVGAVTSGRWLVDLLAKTAPHLMLRDQATLEAHYRASGEVLQQAIVDNAAKASAAIGAVAGALASAEEMLPPSLAAAPAQLAAETLLSAVIELKMIGELRAAAGQPIVGTPSERGWELLQLWAHERGLGKATVREELTKAIRKRLIRRMGKNIASYAPLMAGAFAGAAVNRRAARHLGERVIADLRRAAR
jgi:hypothetical protein